MNTDVLAHRAWPMRPGTRPAMQLLMAGALTGAFALGAPVSAQQEDAGDAAAPKQVDEQEPGIKAARTDPRLGLVPGRDGDTFGLAFSYTDFDNGPLLDAIDFENHGYGFEAFYNFDLGHGLSLTANAQVIDPVLSRTDTTTIIGARLNVRF